MHPTLHSKAQQDKFNLTKGNFRRTDENTGVSNNCDITILIVGSNNNERHTIRRLLGRTNLFDLRIIQATDPSFAAQKMHAPDTDLAVFATGGWKKRELSRFIGFLRDGNPCPLIVASQAHDKTSDWPKHGTYRFHMEDLTPHLLESTIRNALYTRDIERQLYSATVQLNIAKRDKSRFFAHMSHDLKTPLNAIIGFSDAIKHGIYGPAPTHIEFEKIEKINSVGTQLLNRINNLIDSGAHSCNH